MTTQTIQFESVSVSEVGSGVIAAFLFSGATLTATLASITENGTLKGRYTGTVEDIAAGDYRLVVKFNGYTVSEPDESVTLLLAVGTYVSKRYAVLDTEGRTAIANAVELKLSTDHGDGQWDAVGSGGGGGGGSPVFTAVVVARIATGAAAGWPQDFTIGDAYLIANASSQPLFIKDVADNILSGLGTKLFSDADFVATLRLAPLTDGTRTLDSPPTTIEVKSTDDVGIVYNDDTDGAEFFEIQIPRAKTLLGTTKTKYSCQFIMNWGDDSTFERTVNLGEIKFIRKNAPAT